MQCPQIATGAAIASFEQRIVSRLATLLCRKSSDNCCYPALDALDIHRESEWQVQCLRCHRAMHCTTFLPRLRNPLSNREKKANQIWSQIQSVQSVNMRIWSCLRVWQICLGYHPRLLGLFVHKCSSSRFHICIDSLIHGHK